MNKKIFITGLSIILLAVFAVGCKLPASGAPPSIATEIPVIPTATSLKVGAEPSATSAAPTPVVVTATALPPVAIPTTAVIATSQPATPLPPTPSPLPPASRIEFATGGTSAVVEGQVDAGQTVYYVLNASAAQTMSVKVSSPNANVFLGVFGADGQVFLNSASQDTVWEGALPASQDYYLSLTPASGSSSYSLSVGIPPLAAGPTPNTTPVAGVFDPLATYGQPTFEDNMTGGNINDWTNPVTGLLPDTKYVRITETSQKFYMTGKIAGFSTWYFTWHELTDFYLQSSFNSGSCTSKDAYGLIIRGPQHLAGKSYGYIVAFSCDGEYWVFRLDSANPYTATELVSWTESNYINAGSNQKNVIGIKAVGDTLTFFANGHQIAQVSDSHYKGGRYGLFVSPELTANYTYRVVNMAYWELTP